MQPERWRRISLLFRRALERPPQERAAFLEESCPEDEGLRVAVESLLDSHEQAARRHFIESGPLDRLSGPNTAEMEEPPAEVLPSETELGHYRIIEKLGAGGMGAVYLARDTRLGRRVALKILPALLARDEEFVRRFEQEARAASALNHPNILTVHEIGEAGGRRFIATEYVEGATLREAAAAGRVDVPTALDICVQVAGALSKAHLHGIVHRDIKPENVMVDEEGHVKVLDFGIAKKFAPGLAQDSGPQHGSQINTASGVVLGTSTYMAPEQLRGAELDGRADVWSLGVVLFEMIAGRVPFDAPTYGDLVVSILHDEPPPLSQFAPEAPPELDAILRRALAKKREDRYQSARALQNDLRRLRRRFEDAHDPPPAAAMTSARPEAGPAQHTTIAGQPAAISEQRKQVTVLFADLAGLTSLPAMRDAEELSDATKALVEVIDGVASEYGGAVTKQIGDTVVALWGARAAHEDDPERAVRAALRMQQAAADFIAAQGGGQAQPFLRIGVSTGLVLVSGGGGELTATGEAVRLAQRLQQQSETGGVLISHDTYRHVRGVFDAPAPESLAFEGRGEPVEVYRVLRAKARAFRVRTRGVEGVETRMVGRQGELKHLTDALETASEDRELQIVTVVGEAGLGKSRLLYEFSNWQELLPELWYVFNGRAGESEVGLPYSLLRDVFSFRFEIQDSDSPEVARGKLERGLIALSVGPADEEELRMRAHFIGQLIGFDFSESPHLAGVLDDVRQLRDRAFRYAAEFFADISRRYPVLLYLDDIHWADDGSLDFVDYLVRHCAHVPMFVLCLARPVLLERRPAWGEGEERHTRLTLRPLTKKESRQLFEEILRQARDVPADLRDLVVSGAEGNPFYVEELIKMLIDQRVIVPGAEVWSVDATRLGEIEVPPTLTGVLQARLDRLSPQEKAVLQRASVVGRIFWDGAVAHLGERATVMVRAVTEVPNGVGGPSGAGVGAVLEQLRRKELVYRREASSFAGAREYTFKHALLRDVTYESVLKRDRRDYHRRAAEWLARQSGGRAGEYAGLVAEHYERAGETGEAAEWNGRAGRQARETYAPEAAISFYRKAIEFASAQAGAGEVGEVTRARRVEWHEGLGETLRVQSRYDEAAEAYEQMRASAEALGDRVAQARAWNGLALVEAARGDNRAMLEAARRAAQLAEEAGVMARARRELANALNHQSQALTRLGDARQAMMLGDRALALASGLGEEGRTERAYSLKSLGMAYHVLARFEQAESCKEQALAIYRELGDRVRVGNMLNSLGETARLRGDYERAFNRYQEALAVAREIGNRPGELFYLGNLGASRLGMGDCAGAEIDLRQSIELALAAGYRGVSENYRFLAEALLGQGKTKEALGAARRALSLSREFENHEHEGEAWRVLGLISSRTGESIRVGEADCDAGACFAQSMSVFARIPLEAESARTLRDWARHESERGDPDDGRRMWEKARETFRRLGMTDEAERMSEE
jgi:predicted ATPase/class 3 adenylate cyclase/predicted Ser/Thr protein kinase